MQFKAMPPSLIRELTKGEEDVLTHRASLREQAIRARPCPKCGGEMSVQPDSTRPFSREEALPRVFGICEHCGFTYDPGSGLVVSVGKSQ